MPIFASPCWVPGHTSCPHVGLNSEFSIILFKPLQPQSSHSTPQPQGTGAQFISKAARAPEAPLPCSRYRAH